MNGIRTRLKSADDLHEMRRQAVAEQQAVERRVRVCLGTGCMAKGSEEVFQEFQKAADETGQGAFVPGLATGPSHGVVKPLGERDRPGRQHVGLLESTHRAIAGHDSSQSIHEVRITSPE